MEGAELSDTDTISDEQRTSLLTVLSETDNIQAVWHTGLNCCIKSGIPPCSVFDDEGIKAAYWLKEHNGKLYSATNEGLFAVTLEEKLKEPENKITLKGRIETDYENLDKAEPDVTEVQSQALKFASLPTSDDYKRYRLQARFRNLVPRVAL